jgi:phytoene dehydrogenase-like protein
MTPTSTVVIGAGPAGLSAACVIATAGAPVTVLEADPRHVGGIARTVEYKGYRFDIGGHRFFSKSIEINELWRGGRLIRYRAARDGMVVFEREPGLADAFRIEAVRFWCDARPCSSAATNGCSPPALKAGADRR